MSSATASKIVDLQARAATLPEPYRQDAFEEFLRLDVEAGEIAPVEAGRIMAYLRSRRWN